MKEHLFDKLTPVYEEMWDSVEKNGFDVNSLSEFRTRVGSHYQKESDSPFGLLIAGRCPNGWDEPFWNYLSANGCSEPFREERIIETTAKSTRVCKFLAYECEGRLFIITDRPETFARQKFADKVCMIIDQWLRKNR